MRLSYACKQTIWPAPAIGAIAVASLTGPGPHTIPSVTGAAWVQFRPEERHYDTQEKHDTRPAYQLQTSIQTNQAVPTRSGPPIGRSGFPRMAGMSRQP